MEPRAVESGRGWQWIVDGFSIFKKSPLMWIVMTIAVALNWMVSFLIPVVGPLIFNLLSPVIFAGLMVGCRAVDSGEELEIAHLVTGFKTHATPLVTIGGVYLVGTIVIFGVIFVTAGGSMLPALLSKTHSDLEAVAAALRSMALALTIGLAFYVPLIMLIWFAPLLVVFDGLSAVDGMKLSFRACMANVLPFLVYGIAILVLWFIASIPFLLGLLLLVPVLVCSVYASYRDIFSAATPPIASGNPLLK